MTRSSRKKVEQERARAALNVKKGDGKREQTTLARVAREYHERVIEPTRSEKRAAQWIQSLETHVPDAIWHKPVAMVEAEELLDFLEKLQLRVPETASRVRQRLDAVFKRAVLQRSVLNTIPDRLRRLQTFLTEFSTQVVGPT